MGAFALLESRIAKPIMPLRIVKLRSLTTSSVVRGLSFAAMFAVFFFGALYLERVLGYDPVRTGVAFLPLTLAMAIMSLGVTSRLLARFGPMKLLIPGMTMAVIGLLWLSRSGVHANYFVAHPAGVLVARRRHECVRCSALTIAMADVPREDAGLASGIVNVSMWLASSRRTRRLWHARREQVQDPSRQGLLGSQSLVWPDITRRSSSEPSWPRSPARHRRGACVHRRRKLVRIAKVSKKRCVTSRSSPSSKSQRYPLFLTTMVNVG